MLNEFKTFVQEALQLNKDGQYLLAISGGIDSVVMADLFYQSGFSFDIVHCNFRLRGAESDEDEAFVRNLAQSYGVKCIVKSFDTQKQADSRGVSVQMAARHIRYAWFEQLMQGSEYREIATAHHKNDVLETMVFNLVKGTGISGLRGIRHRQGHIIRPLLFTDKQQIRQYAQQHQLQWREDSSNAEDKYRRNFIRHEVIPVLEQINPNLFQTLEGTLERLIGAEALVKASCAQIRKKCLARRGDDYFLRTAQLMELPGLNVVMHEILKDFGLHYQQSATIARMLMDKNKEAYVGKVFDSATHRVNLDREEIVISPLASRPKSVASEISEKEHSKKLDFCDLDMRVLDASRYNIMPLANVAALDHEKLKFPLKLRKWQEGDSFYPLGMNCRKKLSDFMIDTKVPLNLKERVFVLTSGEDIVWVVGHRIDHRYRITDQTRQVYEVTQHVRS